MTISICVGSSCHLKGSYDVIEAFKEAISKFKVQDKIELKASFCLGRCSCGVTIKAGERFIQNVNAQNAAEIFEKEILTYL